MWSCAYMYLIVCGIAHANAAWIRCRCVCQNNGLELHCDQWLPASWYRCFDGVEVRVDGRVESCASLTVSTDYFGVSHRSVVTAARTLSFTHSKINSTLPSSLTSLSNLVSVGSPLTWCLWAPLVRGVRGFPFTWCLQSHLFACVSVISSDSS